MQMKIVLVNQNNIFLVQGTAEPYYVYRFFAKNNQIIGIIGNRKNSKTVVPGTAKIVNPISYIPYTIWFNIVTAFYLFKFRKSYNYIYTYKETLFVGILFKVFGARVCCDFRTEPVEQEIEFGYIQKKKRKFKIYLKKNLYKMTIPFCDKLITLSEEIKETLVNQYGANEQNIDILPLGVDLKVFKPNFKRKLENNALRLINVTSLSPERQIETELNAVRILRQMGIPVYLTIVGGGSKKYVNRLKIICKQMKIDSFVDWRGYVPHQSIPKFLSKNDIALSTIPNLRAYQVASVSKLFEYLAMELVVVASDVLSNRKIIKHEFNGLLFKSSDENSLAEQIQRLWEDKNLYYRIKAETRKSIEKYNWASMINQVWME